MHAQKDKEIENLNQILEETTAKFSEQSVELFQLKSENQTLREALELAEARLSGQKGKAVKV